MGVLPVVIVKLLVLRAVVITALIVTALTFPYLAAAGPAVQTFLAYAAITASLAALYLVFQPKGVLRAVALAGGLPGVAVLIADAAMALVGREVSSVFKMITLALLVVSAVAMLTYAVLTMAAGFKARVLAGRLR